MEELYHDHDYRSTTVHPHSLTRPNVTHHVPAVSRCAAVSFTCACFPRLRGGGSAGQREAAPERFHQEDPVPGQPAAQPAEDPAPCTRGTPVPGRQDLPAGQSRPDALSNRAEGRSHFKQTELEVAVSSAL